MRGKPPEKLSKCFIQRITPAYAGKTLSPPHGGGLHPDHPRVCGENLHLIHIETSGAGSPPRMRGKLSPPTWWGGTPRITPAYAGKTIQSTCAICLTKDHPRVCGENLPIPDKRLGTLGSPPRMRGKRSGMVSALCITRITPAYAGKTGVHHIVPLMAEDHPRVCGENSTQSKAIVFGRGSPPRMRGKHAICYQSRHACRITPAYAGKTLGLRPLPLRS